MVVVAERCGSVSRLVFQAGTKKFLESSETATGSCLSCA